MIPALAVRPAQSSLGDPLGQTPDWQGLGLVLLIVGSFLLANAILFRHPRQLVQDYFGNSITRLRSIREYIFHRVQVHLGFLFLLGGFGLQLYGHYRPRPELTPGTFPTVWVGGVILVTIVLWALGWWYSLLLGRRYVRAYLRDNPAPFATDGRLARDVGELFGLVPSSEDTIESYLVRLHARLDLRTPRKRPERGGMRGAPIEGAGEEELVQAARLFRAGVRNRMRAEEVSPVWIESSAT